MQKKNDQQIIAFTQQSNSNFLDFFVDNLKKTYCSQTERAFDLI